MSKVFVSGPMTREDSSQIFDEAVQTLKGLGYEEIFDPSKIDYDHKSYQGKPSSGFRQQIAELSTSDVLVLLDGWQNSRGCVIELVNAVVFGLEIFELKSSGLIAADYNSSNINSAAADLFTNQQRNF